jgi:predicted DNA-binding transcriptional regulator YafY
MSDISAKKTRKSDRLLQIYSRLVDGETLQKNELAQQFHVSGRAIQRDMMSLRNFFAENHLQQEIIYDRGYRLEQNTLRSLSNSEILAVCKILLESRSMRRDEMLPILDKLLDCCVPERCKKAVTDLIANEKFHYVEPHHGQAILGGLWEIGQAVQNHQVLEITYERLKEPRLQKRVIEPVGLMFSEYYFYLTAYVRHVDREKNFENKDDPFPTIYRIDRIREYRVLDEHFRVPYKDRFEEGQFRKRVQFMYGGKLETIRFQYTGLSLEAVLDRLPTAQVLETSEDGWIVEAEVFGDGIQMWLRSQGGAVRVLEPETMVKLVHGEMIKPLESGAEEP